MISPYSKFSYFKFLRCSISFYLLCLCAFVFSLFTFHFLVTDAKFCVSTASAASTISTGATITSTGYNAARKLVRDNSGNLYLAYHKTSGGTWAIFVAKSTDNGNTWTDMGGAPIQTVTGYNQSYPSMAVDSSDNLHCVWQGKCRGRSRTCPTGQPQGLPLQKYSGGS